MAPPNARRHPEKTSAMQDFLDGFYASKKHAEHKLALGEFSPEFVAGFVFRTSGEFIKTPSAFRSGQQGASQ